MIQKQTIQKLLAKFNPVTERNAKAKDWLSAYPHFGGVAPHRYQGQAFEYVKNTRSRAKVCVYCLRPEDVSYHELKSILKGVQT